jgi:ribose transport system permease protein
MNKNINTIISKVGLIFALVLIYLLFVFVAPASFSSTRNLEMILRQTVIVGTAAIGMTVVIVGGGIDLSCGSVVAFSSVTIAYLVSKLGMEPFTAVLCSVVVSTFFGLIIGLLVTRLKVAPFIVTLGMMLVIRGAAKGLAKEQKIDAPYTWLNEILATLPPERGWMLLPAGVWILLILAVIMSLMLRYTKLGRHIYAIGSNELTAVLCGVPVNRNKVIIYSISACFAGIAGLMQFSRLTVGDPTVAIGLELDVIAAVVIGGASLAGGEGTILGSLVGALIMTVIRSGCTQMGRSNWEQEIITGIIIVAAVALDRFRHKRR